MPEYPETSTNSGVPLSTTRSKEASKVSISRSRPYSFSGIRSRSGLSCSQREVVDMSPRLPLLQTAAKIALHAGCGLVTLFGSLGKQLQMIAENFGNIFPPLGGRQRLPGNVTVNPLHWIGRNEWETARQQSRKA